MVALNLMVRDISGQKSARVKVRREDLDSTVGELFADVASDLELVDVDSNGRPLAYQPRLEREGRHLHTSERIGDVLQDQDTLTLQPSIDAG